MSTGGKRYPLGAGGVSATAGATPVDTETMAETLDPRSHEDVRARARPSWTPFAAASFALFVLLVGSNLPTPLFPVYAKSYGLSPLGVTLLFATYTLLVIPALLVFGPLSDAKGRREVLVAAILTAAVAAGLFAAAQSVVVLFVAQAVQAAALGALQGTAAPTLVELDPTENGRRASSVASGLTVGGAAMGPLVAGLLAQYAPLPQRLAYLVEMGLLAVALTAVLIRLPPQSARRAWRPRRPTVPAPIRRQFAIAGVSGFVGWAVTGLFLSLIPSFVTVTLKHNNLALAGGVVALMLATAALIQIAGQRVPSLPAQALGLAAMIAGVAALLIATTSASLLALLIGTVLAGAGQGLAFMGSLGDIGEIAPAERKGDIVASYYVIVYLGTALPVIGVGALAVITAFTTAVEIFAYVVIAVCLFGMLALTAELRSRK